MSTTRSRNGTKPFFFFNHFDVAAVNSFLLHKEVFKLKNNEANITKPHTQKTFREKLDAEMVEFTEGVSPSVPSSLPLTCMPMYNGSNATQGRRYCKRFQEEGMPREKTPIYCRRCRASVCNTSEKNCFKQRHDAKVIEMGL